MEALEAPIRMDFLERSFSKTIKETSFSVYENSKNPFLVTSTLVLSERAF